jgi:hypothetical protein
MILNINGDLTRCIKKRKRGVIVNNIELDLDTLNLNANPSDEEEEEEGYYPMLISAE